MTNRDRHKWDDILPQTIAAHKAAWERGQQFLRAYESGEFTYERLGRLAGIGKVRMAQIINKATRSKVAPACRWISQGAIAMTASCVGGPLAGSEMTGDQPIIPCGGGRYYYNGNRRRWVWVEGTRQPT